MNKEEYSDTLELIKSLEENIRHNEKFWGVNSERAEKHNKNHRFMIEVLKQSIDGEDGRKL